MARVKRKKKKKSILPNLILFGVLLVGLSLLLYPSLSDYWNSFHQSRAIMGYMEQVAQMDTAEYDHLIGEAHEYNARVAADPHWTLTEEERADYESQLNFNERGNMGFITIDKISVQLPIYHGTDERVLQSSIGHFEGSSLPVGGESTHCVLTGHRGLPSAKLFSDLDKLNVGDTFTISVLNETLTYAVDQIRVVEPTDLTPLTIARGRDYCTLVTCTPYGINTHRLLVRGHRIANIQGEAKVVPDAMQIEVIYVVPFVGVPILTLLLIMLLVSTSYRSRRPKVRDAIGELDDEEFALFGVEDELPVQRGRHEKPDEDPRTTK